MNKDQVRSKDAGGSGFFVLHIDDTANDAFRHGNGNAEVSRIVTEVAENIRGKPVLDSVSLTLRDANGNRVGRAEFSDVAPSGEPVDGHVLLVIELGNRAFDNGNAGSEAARIMREASDAIGTGARQSVFHDSLGNPVGRLLWQENPSLGMDGRIDMADALSDGRVYMADNGFSGIADGEHRYVVTTPDFEPGYGEGDGLAWLANAIGETASGSEEPETIQERHFRKLTDQEKSDLEDMIQLGVTGGEDYEPGAFAPN